MRRAGDARSARGVTVLLAEGGEIPVAAVILNEGATVSGAELRDWINEHVAARYQRVSEVVTMKDFPRSAAGKTLKREMREPYWAGREKKI
jgi:acyl-CoA synthetase (AMP-forming)/AMP-acid ligase II